MDASLPWYERTLDRFLAACNRLLSSDRFRRWAAAFPLTRPIARRRARSIFDLCAGFVYSQVLLACVRLDLFSILAERPQTLAALSHRLGLTPAATERLVLAAVALKLVVPASRGRYRLGPLGAPLVGNAAITSMVEHHALLYADLRDPVALLRGQAAETALGAYWPYASAAAPSGINAGSAASYSTLMSASQPLVAEELLDAHDFRRHRRLLDIGGGEGGFLASAAKKAPDLELMLFDLPPVVERARLRFTSLGLNQRAQAFGGSFLSDPLPKGADLMTLVRVVHDHDDDSVRILLRSAFEALPRGGVLLIAEPMSETPGAEPVGDAYFGFYLLAMGRGRPRSVHRLFELLREAGFGALAVLPTRMPLQTSVIRAVVPQ